MTVPNASKQLLMQTKAPDSHTSSNSYSSLLYWLKYAIIDHNCFWKVKDIMITFDGFANQDCVIAQIGFY